MVPHVTFVAPVETEVTWDGTSPCALLKEFGDAMTSDSGTTITNTILPRTSPTTISVIDNAICIGRLRPEPPFTPTPLSGELEAAGAADPIAAVNANKDVSKIE